MYSHTRNPNPTDISLDTKAFLNPLRNYYTPRGNNFYNIELGKNPPPMIQVQINYNNNIITVKEGSNFKINLISGLFRGGDVVTVVDGGKSTQYRLQKDANYARNNMKLFCDPNFGYDSYVTVGNFEPEVNTGYTPQPPQPVQGGQAQVAQSQYPQQVAQSQYPQQFPQFQYPQQIPASFGQPQFGQFSSRLGYQQYQQVYPGMPRQGFYPQQVYGMGRGGYGGYQRYYY